MGLTLFHDFTSPGSAVAVLRVQRLADEGLDVAFAGFEGIGVDVVLPVTIDVVAGIADLHEIAQAEGLTLRRPRGLPPTAAAHTVGALADAAGLGASWRLTAYRAFWEDGAPIGDRGVLVDLADAAGLERAPVAAALDDPGRVAATRRAMAVHRRNGVGGVPTILAARTLVPGLLPVDELRALAALA